ncbi:flagellar motor switch protein FliG [Azospirillum sp. SYSU D00513]|uniref:flagellar motor switch protein FliG n=1 Tax=Azospirillum sp. SYSU D00513 TaxID=2812561 RepID=UPI001A95C0D8|nr:flagellar motor switch protein FliG [Azospirillum sp. SYSU D00513]
MAKTSAAIANRLKTLPGIEQVAIIILAIEEDSAADLLKKFDEDDTKEIFRTLRAMGAVQSETVEAVLSDFADRMSRSTVFGSDAAAEQILSKMMPPDKVRSFMADLRGPAGRNIWEKLQNVPEQQLATWLRSQHPQTAAYALTKIPSSQAAKVFKVLPRPYLKELTPRMIAVSTTPKLAVDTLEKSLRNELLVGDGRGATVDKHGIVADIFNELDKELEDYLFDVLEEEMPESAERIRTLMFTFNDLEDLDEEGMKVLVDAVPGELLPTALRGASDTLLSMFWAALGERGSKAVRTAMENDRKPKKQEVETAKRQIVEICKRLERENLISFGEDEEDY